MSVSLSQKLGKSVRLVDRFSCAFALTDEMFAVISGKEQQVGMRYIYGLVLFPYVGWGLGTFIGALIGSVLPPLFVTALSISMYAMFIAILVPASVSDHHTLIAVLLAIGVSCAFAYIPALGAVSSGFVVIISAVSVSLLMTLVAPLKDDQAQIREVQGNE